MLFLPLKYVSFYIKNKSRSFPGKRHGKGVGQKQAGHMDLLYDYKIRVSVFFARQ